MFQEGLICYGNLDYHCAQKKFSGASREAPVTLPKHERLEIERYLAITYIALGEEEKAENCFERMLTLNRDYHIDPERVSPKVFMLFEKVRRTWLKEHPPVPSEPVKQKTEKPSDTTKEDEKNKIPEKPDKEEKLDKSLKWFEFRLACALLGGKEMETFGAGDACWSRHVVQSFRIPLVCFTVCGISDASVFFFRHASSFAARFRVRIPLSVRPVAFAASRGNRYSGSLAGMGYRTKWVSVGAFIRPCMSYSTKRGVWDSGLVLGEWFCSIARDRPLISWRDCTRRCFGEAFEVDRAGHIVASKGCNVSNRIEKPNRLGENKAGFYQRAYSHRSCRFQRPGVTRSKSFRSSRTDRFQRKTLIIIRILEAPTVR